MVERARDGSGGVKFFFSKKPVRREGGIILHELHIHFVVTFPMPNNAIAHRIFKEMVIHLGGSVKDFPCPAVFCIHACITGVGVQKLALGTLHTRV